MKVVMLSSMEPKCGIASYTADLNKPLARLVDLSYRAFPGIHDRGAWEKLARDLNRETDLVHIQYHPQFCGYWRTPTLARTFHDFLKKLSVPSVITVHDLLDHEFFEARGNPAKTFFQKKVLAFFLSHTPFGRFLKGGFMKPGRHFIAHWKKSESELIHLGMDSQRISVLYPGIPEILNDDSVKPFEFIKNRRSIGMLGFIREDKGYSKMLHVLQKLPQDIVLLALGEVPEGNRGYLEELKCLAKSLGVENRFHMTGYLSDAKSIALLRECCLIALPYDYRHHTASYALSYAMAARRSILVSNMEYFQEIKDLCPSLRIYDRKNPESLPSVVSEMIGSETSPDCSKDPFYLEWTWERVAEKTVRVYEKVLNNGALK